MNFFQGVEMKRSALTSFFVIILMFLSSCSTQRHPKQTFLIGAQLKEGNITSQIKAIKKDIPHPPSIYAIDIFLNEDFPKKIAEYILDKEAILLINLKLESTQSYSVVDVNELLDGIWNEHLEEWAEDIKSYQYPVLICVSSQSNSSPELAALSTESDTYLSGITYIKELFKKKGAMNIYWGMEWVPNNASNIDTKESPQKSSNFTFIRHTLVMKENAHDEWNPLKTSHFRHLPEIPLIVTLRKPMPYHNDTDDMKQLVQTLKDVPHLRAIIFDVHRKVECSFLRPFVFPDRDEMPVLFGEFD